MVVAFRLHEGVCSGEIALDFADVDVAGHHIIFHRHGSGETGGFPEPLHVPLHPELLACIEVGGDGAAGNDKVFDPVGQHDPVGDLAADGFAVAVQRP